MIWLLILYGVLGGALFGYDLGCITGALPLMLNDTSLALTDPQAELVVGYCKCGAAAGALAGVWLLRRGHTLCFWLSSLAFIAGPLLVAGANGWLAISAGRLVVGVGIGLSAVASPTYLAEIAPPSRRGGIVALYELALSLGLLAASLVNTALELPAVSHWLARLMPNVATWRLMLGLPGLPAVPLFFGCLCLPEAPATLVAAGRRDAALRLLLRLRGVRIPSLAVEAAEGQTSLHDEPTSVRAWLPSHFWRRPPPSPAADALRYSSDARQSHSSIDVADRRSGEVGEGRSIDRTSAESPGMRWDSPLRFTAGGSSRATSFAELPLTPSAEVLSQPYAQLSEAQRAKFNEALAALEALTAAHRSRGGAAGSGSGSVGALSLLLGPERRAACLMIVLAIANQANGSSTLLNYGAALLTDSVVGVPPDVAGLLCSFAAVLKLTCVALSALSVDRCGRRPLLLIGAAVSTCGLALGSYASLPPPTAPAPAAVTPVGVPQAASLSAGAPLVVVSLYLFVGAYALSLAPIFYTLLSELFSPAARPLAAGVATAITFAAGGAADTSFLTMRDAWGYPGVFAAYALVCALGGLVVLLMLPETRGKSLPEAQAAMVAHTCCVCAKAGDEAARAAQGAEWARGDSSSSLVASLSGSAREPSAARPSAEEEEPPPLKSRTSSAFVIAV